jgi:hypothetical protein
MATYRDALELVIRREFGEVSVISCRVALTNFFMKNGLESPL